MQRVSTTRLWPIRLLTGPQGSSGHRLPADMAATRPPAARALTTGHASDADGPRPDPPRRGAPRCAPRRLRPLAPARPPSTAGPGGGRARTRPPGGVWGAPWPAPPPAAASARRGGRGALPRARPPPRASRPLARWLPAWPPAPPPSDAGGGPSSWGGRPGPTPGGQHGPRPCPSAPRPPAHQPPRPPRHAHAPDDRLLRSASRRPVAACGPALAAPAALPRLGRAEPERRAGARLAPRRTPSA
jgi:hypothetical protein